MRSNTKKCFFCIDLSFSSVCNSEAASTTGYSPIICFTVQNLDSIIYKSIEQGATLDGPIKCNDYVVEQELIIINYHSLCFNLVLKIFVNIIQKTQTKESWPAFVHLITV